MIPADLAILPAIQLSGLPSQLGSLSMSRELNRTSIKRTSWFEQTALLESGDRHSTRAPEGLIKLEMPPEVFKRALGPILPSIFPLASNIRVHQNSGALSVEMHIKDGADHELPPQRHSAVNQVENSTRNESSGKKARRPRGWWHGKAQVELRKNPNLNDTELAILVDVAQSTISRSRDVTSWRKALQGETIREAKDNRGRTITDEDGAIAT